MRSVSLTLLAIDDVVQRRVGAFGMGRFDFESFEGGRSLRQHLAGDCRRV